MTSQQTFDAWTPAEDAELIRLRLAGNRLDQCVGILNRTYAACQARYCTLVRMGHAPKITGKALAKARGEKPAPSVPRKPRPGRTQRNCLCCGGEFSSEGPHNRLCDGCRRIAASPFDTPAVIRYR